MAEKGIRCASKQSEPKRTLMSDENGSDTDSSTSTVVFSNRLASLRRSRSRVLLVISVACYELVVQIQSFRGGKNLEPAILRP